ncbi:uncharacterized protein LOC110419608 [Herrania umbratica]|uniref:Uncharacterized protein LOC110419608 n=1 Tax=Herrania umbratica TaxID=108875 RepID=A0A6J1AMD1_9ROSI|nr:uncharacterized protein LOC110419608 [Herrania umbratica]
MAETRMGSKKQKSETTYNKEMAQVQPNWGGMDDNLLQHVFRFLPTKDLIHSATLVCHNWKLACWEFLFWKDHETLDISSLRTLLGPRKPLLKGLKYVMKLDTKEGCCPVRIRNIIFSTHLDMKFYHLAFVAKRSPKLRTLVLPGACDITMDLISTIIKKNWGELEELSLGPLAHDCSDRFFQRISNCKNLTRLHIFGSPLSSTASRTHFILDENNASIIAEHLLQLRVFNIDGTKLHKFGVETLLSECKNLTELNLRHCRGVVDPPISFLILTPKMKLLRKTLTVKIKSGSVKNCTKTWFTCSSGDSSLCTAEELVNQLWTGDVEEIVRFKLQIFTKLNLI